MSLEPTPATIVAPAGRSRDGELDQAQVLLVVERRRLAGGAADDEAVRAVRRQMVHQADERLLVDAQPSASNGVMIAVRIAAEVHDLSVPNARVRRPPHTRPLTMSSPSPRARSPPTPAARPIPSARALRAEVTAVRWQAPEGGFAVVAALTDAGEEVT